MAYSAELTQKIEQVGALLKEINQSHVLVAGVVFFEIQELHDQHCPTCRAGFVVAQCVSAASLIDHVYQQVVSNRDATRN